MRQDQAICPIEFSDRLGRDFFETSTADKAELGQYFTPSVVADFMAGMLKPVNKDCVRILDPGAGSGVLAAAAVKALIKASPKTPSQIHVELYEVDKSLIRRLSDAMENLKAWTSENGSTLTFKVHNADFVLEKAKSLKSVDERSLFDVVISNPPYFKVSKDDPRAVACSSIVYGQPNIYAFFMAISAALLFKGGQMVFITPRSFAAGQYFKAFREFFFSRIAIERIHQFVSRVDAFDRDNVLQENIITYGFRGEHSPKAKIEISCSQGRSDLAESSSLVVQESEILDVEKDFTLMLPSNRRDLAVLEMVTGWKNSLEKMNLKISTGPVVPFRATELILMNESKDSIPLYWIQHVKPMVTEFPVKGFRKQQWIKSNKNSRKLLVENQNMILMRRFSPKEDFRRLTVAPFRSSEYSGELVGLENHLNYIYRPNGKFKDEEMYGLAAFLSSSLFDAFFRISNGNTQVSATELRSAPLPPSEVINQIGTLILKSKLVSHQAIDEIVNELLDAKELH